MMWWPPWLLAALMLAVYLATLNPWVSPDSLGTVASLTGMIWGPEHLSPITYVLTRPLRWLPAQYIPQAVNIFTALCAAASLAMLARAVSLLPHRIYRRNLKQCRNRPTLLNGPWAWLPPILAVLTCGWQYTFWQSATDATGEMVTLLLFAYTTRCLPEYSASQDDKWLMRGAFAFGLALANDWNMTAFVPALLVSLFWVKRLQIFDVPFLTRLLRNPHSFKLHLLVVIPGCCLAGLSVFFLKPILTGRSLTAHEPLGKRLKEAVEDHLAAAPLSTPFTCVCLAVLVIPLVYLMVRYYHGITALKRVNTMLPRIVYHLIHGFFGATCLCVLLDAPLSPRWLGLEVAPLPLYFLAALCGGYFAAHFVRLAEAKKTRDRPLPVVRPRRRRHQRTVDYFGNLKTGVRAFTTAIAVVFPALLLYKNLPVILQTRNSPVNKFFAQVGQSLPAHGAVVICNDPFFQDYVEAAVNRAGGQGRFLFLNADALQQNSEYYEYLKNKYPAFHLDLADAWSMNLTNRERGLARLIQNLAQNHEIFCPQPSPSFAFLSQNFYAQPDGLIYQLKSDPAAATTIQPPILPPITASETFWDAFEKQIYPRLADEIQRQHMPVPRRLRKRMMAFHPELDKLNSEAAVFYAIALNNWGVELQRRDHIKEAGVCFDQARQLDQDNSAAEINQKFNQDYQNGKAIVIRNPQEEEAALAEYRDWKHVAHDGLVDEPGFCNLMGQLLSNAAFYRPAVAEFERLKKFAPNNLVVSENLAVAYFNGNDYSDALGEATRVVESEPNNTNALFIKGVSSVQLNDYEEAIPPLTALLELEPDYGAARLSRAIAYSKIGEVQAARRDYERVTETNPEAYPAYYNLAEIADHDRDVPKSIKYYELFLKYAPGDQPQINLAEARLKALKTMTP